MEIIQSSDGFLWGDVTDKAIEIWHASIFPLYVLHNDGSESLVETESDIEQAFSNGLVVAIEIGLPSQMTDKKVKGTFDWETADKKIIDGFVYIKSTDILFCE